MITVRRAAERGRSDLGWLDSRHTFSFGDYHDERFMGFRDLRVINDDRVRASRGFGTHGHRDMEIVSYVLEGALEHRDSLGTGSVIRPGEVQRMSAGSGVTHSEFNASETDDVHFLQIWILPAARGLAPSYEQRPFPPEEKRGRLRLVGAPDGRDGAVTIHQDVAVYATLLDPGQRVAHRLRPGRYGWIQVVRGSVRANETTALAEADGAAVADEALVSLQAHDAAEVLLFDLA
jgi:redox-sensitive bicupin YhaK (pirin superfamily)